MTETERKGFCIDDWQVSPAEGLLVRGDESVRLEPRTMEVLVYLAAHPGEVITREILERDVWHGAVVGYDAVTNTVIKLRKALQDDARQPRYIVTIPKKGYQLIAPIRDIGTTASTDVNAPHDTVPPAVTEQPGKRPVTKKYLVLGALGAIVVAALVWLWPLFNSTHEEVPSIIVLPFVNLSDDPRQEFLADGITEDIVTDLSRLSSIRVLAGNTALRYKGRQVSADEIGRDLGVAFVLQGNIRSLGNELRLNVQLVNTATGYNVWAQRYDRKLADVFTVQDEVTHSIVNALAVKLTSQEKQRLARKATDSLQAYDYFQEGQRLFKVNTREANQQASEMYRKAIALDPGYGRAYGAQAVVLTTDNQRGWTDTPVETLDRALELAKKAVALDDTTPQTYWALGFVYMVKEEFEKAEQAAIRAIEIAPNYADGYGLRAIINSYKGLPEKAIEMNRKGISLNPYYSFEYLISAGLAYYTMGDYSTAVAKLEEAGRRNPNSILVKLFLAASYVKAGRQNEAEWTVTEMEILNPNKGLSWVATSLPLARSDIKHSILNDLRAAGLPD